MSPFAHTFSTNSTASLPERRSFGAVFERHRLAFNVASALLVVLFAAAYIILVNQSAASGYDVHALESRISTLSLENERLQADVDHALALDRVSHASRMLGFVPAGTPQYVTSAPPAFALANTNR